MNAHQGQLRQDADPAGRFARTTGSGRSTDSCSVCRQWLWHPGTGNGTEIEDVHLDVIREVVPDAELGYKRVTVPGQAGWPHSFLRPRIE